MCIFAQPVRAVKNTKILVSSLGADMQLTVYQNSVQATSTKNAMVLPVPSAKPIILLDFSKNGSPFDPLNACFPTLDHQERFRGKSALASLGGRTLQVHDIGNYKVSVAPDLKDLRRVDTSVFTLAPDIDKLLADQYGGNFSFVVCRMTEKSIDDDAIGYVSADFGKGKLFVPTMHGHDGHADAEPDWDHNIYSLGCHGVGQGACDGSGSSPAEDLARLKAEVDLQSKPASLLTLDQFMERLHLNHYIQPMKEKLHITTVAQLREVSLLQLREIGMNGIVCSRVLLAVAGKRDPGSSRPPDMIHGQPTEFARAMMLLNAVLKEAKVAVDSVTGKQVAVKGVQLPKFGMDSLRRLRVKSGPNKDLVFAKSDTGSPSAASASTEVTTAASAASASTEEKKKCTIQ